MSVSDLFSDNYLSARNKFRETCKAAGLTIEHYPHPQMKASDGSRATVDVARLGSETAETILFIISGCHGLEAFAGSAIQTDLIKNRHKIKLPMNTAIILIHTINLYGTVHRRRNTDGNLDLCRNFVDFEAGELPQNPDYEVLAPAINAEISNADEQLARFIQDNGPEAYIAAIMGGQYKDPQGFTFGGDAPCWSRDTLLKIALNHGGKAKRIAVVDFHTGLGERGKALTVCLQTGPRLDDVLRWFDGQVEAPGAKPVAGSDPLHPASGHPTSGFLWTFPDKDVYYLVVEFGTVPPHEILPVFLKDHRLVRAGLENTEECRKVRQLLLEQHCPNDPEWRASVLTEGRTVLDKVLIGLAVENNTG